MYLACWHSTGLKHRWKRRMTTSESCFVFKREDVCRIGKIDMYVPCARQNERVWTSIRNFLSLFTRIWMCRSCRINTMLSPRPQRGFQELKKSPPLRWRLKEEIDSRSLSLTLTYYNEKRIKLCLSLDVFDITDREDIR